MKIIDKVYRILLLALLLISFGKMSVLHAATEVTIESINTSLFPFIYSSVSVSDDNSPVLSLTRDDFSVFENNIIQRDFFEVIPPQSSGGVRLADIVFLIDCSGSMGGEIADVRNNVINFANALEGSDIDYRLGLVRFGYGNGNPYIFNNGNLTGDVEQFRSFVSQLRASGGYEPAYWAMRQAMTGFTYRPGSQKIFLVITDEDSDQPIDKQSTINMAIANSITVHAAARCSSGYSQSHFCDNTSIRAITGGQLFGVSSSYSQVLDSIAAQASNAYIVRYRSSNPYFDGTDRVVEIFGTAFSETDSDTRSYRPGASPVIT